MLNLCEALEGLVEPEPKVLSRDEVESLVKEMLNEISKKAYSLGGPSIKVVGNTSLRSLSSVVLCQYTCYEKNKAKREKVFEKFTKSIKDIVNSYQERGLHGTLVIPGNPSPRITTVVYKVIVPNEN